MDPIFGLGASVIFGAIDAVSGAQQTSAAREAEQRRIEAQYKQDMRNYRFNWNQTKREYNYRLQETGIARQNQEAMIGYQEQTALRDYQYGLAIRDFEYGQQLRQYAESERLYGLRRGFNAQAAVEAHSAESRRLNEIMTGMAFDQQDMLVKMLQEDGQVMALGTSGRSTGKALASALSSYGRNQAILAESLLSAERESRVSRRQIELSKYEADLNAESQRMLKPQLGPKPPAPLKMPRATILDPLKPRKGPKPMKGINTMPTNSGLAIANNFLSTGLGMMNSLPIKWT